MAEDHQEEAVVEQPKARKPKRKMVDVSVIAQEGQAALVQWVVPDSASTARGVLPVDAIEDGKCDVAALEAAKPYGVPWGKLVAALLEKLDVSPQHVQDALYAHGIWTVADIEGNTVGAMRAISSITAGIVPALHGMGGEYEKGQGGK
jgi:hypothetical protein